MELSAFAEQVLRGPTLADKLLDPGRVTDARPRFEGSLPEVPGRAPELGFARGSMPATPLRVPDDAAERGALLHAFANHELLAIELLAQALLRFSDAPAAFRRGLLQTLREEQSHLRLYLQRMQALGVMFGSQPLSGFFWRAMSGLDTPSAFVAHLSLTFEQANLDFALHYQRGFAELGDHESAAVLHTVLEDEIGHVALGLRWFERWRDPAVSLFEAHRDALRPPLQVVRAKAAGFEVEPRMRAGLPEAYVERLRTCGGSRGRPAQIWWFNGAVEQEVERGLGFTPLASTRATLQDLETVPLVLARESDVVLVRQPPRAEFLEGLASAGVVLPRFEVAAFERSPWPAPKRIGAIERMCPWGSSPRVDAFAATARVRAFEADAARWSEGMRALYDKRTAVALSVGLSDDPAWCDASLAAAVATTWHEVVSVQAAHAARGFATRVKPAFGAAGRGHRVLADAASDRAFVEGLLRRAGAVVVEPEFEVLAQFSIRLRVEPDGTRVTGLGRCASTARGQFAHAVLGPPDVGLPSQLRRWLRGDGDDPKRLQRMAAHVANAVDSVAQAAGYRGPAGVDALLVETPGGPRLRPLVDLNPRHTMGHVAQALEPLVSTRARAVLCATTLADVRAMGFECFADWATRRLPTTFETRGGARRLHAGVVHLTDPGRASALVMSLCVADSVDAALSLADDRRSPARQSRRSPPTRGSAG